MKKRILSSFMALALAGMLSLGRWPEKHQHCICGKTTHVDIGDHTGEHQITCDKWLASFSGSNLAVQTSSTSSTGTTLTGGGNYVTLTTGCYYLSTTVDNCDKVSYVGSQKTIKIDGDVTICLNGQQIQKVGNTTGSVFEVPSGSTLTLTDCKANGQVMCDHNSNGSGVYVNGGTLNLYSGQIANSNGQKGTGSNQSNKYGGGVYVDNGGTFNMYGGTITGNSADYGGGVYMKSGTFNMYGGTIENNTSSGGYGEHIIFGGAGVYMESGNFIMKNAASVTENTIGYGKTAGAGVYVNGGKFEMHDSASVTGNTTSNSKGSSGGGVYVNNGGEFKMHNNASVTGNKVNDRSNGTLNGAGVYVNSGTFEMNDSASVSGNTASGNKASTTYGGGVYVNSGTFTMNGSASVKDNTATNTEKTNTTYGGGVYVSNNGTFTMNGEATSVSNNKATNGGGVHVNGTFNMNGNASIKSNTGNGVCVNNGTFTVSGAPTVTGNTITKNGAASNVYLTGSGITITIAGKLNDGASIGVTKTSNTLIATGKEAQTVKDAAEKFKSDKTGYEVSVDPDNEKQLVLTKIVVPHTHSWSYQKKGDDSSTIYVSCTGDGDCEYKTKPASVKISMTQSTYPYSENMKAPTAKLTYSANWPSEVKKAQESDITYCEFVASGDSTEISGAPTKVGKYMAKITVGGQTASVVYEITNGSAPAKKEQKPLNLNSTEKTIAVGETLTLKATGGSTDGAVTYHITSGADNAELRGNVLTAKKAGTVTVKATMAGDKTHNDVTSGPLTITITEKSGGTTPSQPGGSSSDRDSSDSNPVIKTETKNNTDGSTTKTETRKDGSVTQTTTAKDGSTSKTTTNPNGSSVTENKAADGSTGTVKTDKNGQTTAETTLSSKAIEDAKKSGEAVTAPVQVEATRDSSTAPTVKIELPRNSGDTKVEIPVTNVKPGTVAVLVHPDGTEEIVKNSLPTEDGIQLTVNGGATVKIVDNSKDFADTRNHWAKDAIDFVSARGLVNGMSDVTYAPNNSTTRAQLWTILARQNDADLTGGATWFENAQNWAKAKGISDGANPNGTINRAQMVTMLWRAMGQPAAVSGASFADVPADSYYAQAVAWAIENGITTGVGGGRFDPNATCTRGQIATFLYRYMK